MHNFGYFIKEALVGFKRNLGTAVGSIITIFLSLLIIGVFLIGGYIVNLELSQQRALAVASYVLEDGYAGISAAQKTQLRAVATANGRSFSDPVLDENGVENMDASRRVVFKFRLTDEQMIQQLKSILEANDAESAE